VLTSRQGVAQNPNPGSAPVHIVSPLPLPVSVQAEGLGPQKASDLVTVQTGTTNCSGGFTGARRVDARVMSDGTQAAFTLPPGRVLVITNLEFDLLSVASRNIQVRLGVPCGAGCMRPIVDNIVSTDTRGQGGTNVTLTNGIAIKSGVELCVADINQSSPNAFVNLHGYFADDK